MKNTLTIIFLSSLFSFAHAQLMTNGKLILELELQSTNGTNATAVTWNPDKSFYYTAIAGNMDYPLETFDANGTWKDEAITAFDVRGLWFNAKKNILEGNTYSKGGLYTMQIQSNGFPSGTAAFLIENSNLQCDQCAAAFDGKKYLWYLGSDLHVYKYSYKSHKASGDFDLKGYSSENVIYTTIVYTGVKGFELGLFDYDTMRFILFDTKGNYKGSSNIPFYGSLSGGFCFSYANGLVWLYDTEERKWSGFDVFE